MGTATGRGFPWRFSGTFSVQRVVYIVMFHGWPDSVWSTREAAEARHAEINPKGRWDDGVYDAGVNTPQTIDIVPVPGV